MAFSLDVPPLPPRSAPNPAWHTAPPSSGSRRLTLALALGVVAAGAIGTGAYVIIGRRGEEQVPPVATPSTSTVPGVTPGTGTVNAPTAPVATPQPVEAPPLQNPPAAKVDASLEITLDDAQKAEYGFPKEWVIRRKVVTPEAGSPYVTFEVLKK